MCRHWLFTLSREYLSDTLSLLLQLTLSSESELFSVASLGDSDVAAESGGTFTPLVPLLRTATWKERNYINSLDI